MRKFAAGLFLLASLSASVFAQDITVTALQGRVRMKHLHRRDYVKAKEGDKLAFGESIATGPKSLAHVDLGNGQTVLIQENSVMTLEGGPDKPRLNFSFGEFLVGLKKKLEKNQSFQVVTPAAVAAARGTLFWGKTDLDKTATFMSFGNTIQVTSQGKTVTVAPGQTVTIKIGEAPPDAKASDVPASYLKTFAVKGSIENLDALLDPKLH